MGELLIGCIKLTVYIVMTAPIWLPILCLVLAASGKYEVPTNEYNNPSTNNIDEAYLLFMGDAVLRNGHPEATTAQQEYYNDNHNCEAW